MADAEGVDGVSVPITREELYDPDVLDQLLSYTPAAVIADLEELEAKFGA